MSYGISSNLISNLTAKGRSEDKVINYVWYDISHSNPSASSPTDVSMNQRIIIADSSGSKTLVPKVSGQDTTFVLQNAFNLVDSLFVDHSNPADPFYTSYVEHYQSATATSEFNDMALSYANIDQDTNLMTVDYSSRHSNNIEFHLNNLANSSVNFNDSRTVRLDTHLDFLESANVVDASANIAINVYNFGTDIADAQYNLGQSNPVLEFNVNTLSNNSIVRFVPDSTANNSEFDSYPKPSIALYQSIASQKVVNAGRSKVTMPVTLPAVDSGFRSGAWNWKVHVEDADTGYKSASRDFRLQVLPRYSAPNVSTSEALSFQYGISHEALSVSVHYQTSDVTDPDIQAWGQFLTVGAEFVRQDNDGLWQAIVPSGFSLTNGGNDMNSRLNLDASANFVIAYNATTAKYSIDNGNYAIRVNYTDGVISNSIIKPINIVGRTHISRITYTNNLDGSYTLSGGNKGASDRYVYYDGSNWYVLSGNRIVVSPNTSYTFAVTDNINAISSSIYAITLNDDLVTDRTIASIDISSGLMFEDVANANVVEMDNNGNIVNNSQNFGGSVQTVTDNKQDVFVNVSTPLWLEQRNDVVVKLILTENVVPGNLPNIIAMDASNNYFHRSALRVGDQNKWQVNIDASLNRVIGGVNHYDISSAPILLDFQLRDERLASSEAVLVAELWFAGQKRYSDVHRYFLKTTVVTNPGNRHNNLIIPNLTKVNFTNAINGSMTKLPLRDISNSEYSNLDISDNTWRNLALGVNAMMYANLPRTDFIGSAGHSFDISGLNITATGNHGTHPIKLWLPFALYGQSNTSGDPLNMDSFGDVSANFSNFGDIFLDLGYFAGTIDIKYSTIYRDESSVDINTLRLVVLPRPNIDLTVRDPSENVHRINAPTWLMETAKNIQRDGNGAEIPFSSSINLLSMSGNGEDATGLIDMYLKISFVSRLFSDVQNPSSGLASNFDVSDNFVPAKYGAISTALVKFNGADLDYSPDGTGDVSNNVHVLKFNSNVTFKRHNYFVAGTQIADNEDFTVYVINDADDVIAATTMVVNDIHMSGTLGINNINFLKYFVADASEEGAINLLTDSRFSNVTFVFIENADHNDVAVTYSVFSPTVLRFAERNLFVRTGSQGWSNWSV